VDVPVLTCLTVLDPTVVVLVGLVRSAGVRSAGGVTALDVTANWIVNWAAAQDQEATAAVADSER
jgi:hypothetical protein